MGTTEGRAGMEWNKWDEEGGQVKKREREVKSERGKNVFSSRSPRCHIESSLAFLLCLACRGTNLFSTTIVFAPGKSRVKNNLGRRWRF